MLTIDQKKNDIIWYKNGEYFFKVKYEGDRAVVWINFKGYNMAKPMLMWDFFVEMEENDIDLKLDEKWNGHIGFKINIDDVLFFIGLIENFINEKELASTAILSEKYSNWKEE
jgi:hypothetical protein